MISKSHAICLRYYPFSNTSRVVQWLTRSGGRIVTLIKGSQRVRSGFLGQYDLFYTCELVYYVRLRSSIHIARECTPIDVRSYLRSDWKACATASYFCDVFSRIIPPHAAQASLFDFLNESLDALATHSGSAEIIGAFEIQLLNRLGLAPRLKHCVNCGTEISQGHPPVYFSCSRGGVICAHCGPRDDVTASKISMDMWQSLRDWQRMPWPPEALRPLQPTTECYEMEDLLGRFLAYHLDVSLPSRSIALDIVRRHLPSVRQSH